MKYALVRETNFGYGSQSIIFNTDTSNLFHSNYTGTEHEWTQVQRFYRTNDVGLYFSTLETVTKPEKWEREWTRVELFNYFHQELRLTIPESIEDDYRFFSEV